MQRLMVAGIAVAVVGLAGCSNVTAGQPMADPDQTGISTPTTSTRTPTRTASPPQTPLFPPPGSSGGGPSIPPPNGMSTTCREYATMDDPTKRGMVELLGENGYPGMKKNPLLWVTFVGAMCVLADPDATVVEAINHKVPG